MVIFISTLKEKVNENNQEISKERERKARVSQQVKRKRNAVVPFIIVSVGERNRNKG